MHTGAASHSGLLYDARNRLTTHYGPDVKAGYQYNGLGERVSKTVNGETTRYRYAFQQLIGEYREDGTPIREYIYLEGQPVAVLYHPASGASASGGIAVHYAHTDHLGAIARMTDGAGAISWDADRLPYGGLAMVVEDVELPLRFPGQYYDRESGLYYNYFRDYDPSMGRYIQSDPIGLAGGINTYEYVNGNPLSYIDSTGLFRKCKIVNKPLIENFGGAVRQVGSYKSVECEGDFNNFKNEEFSNCELPHCDTSYSKCVEKCVSGMNPWWATPISSGVGAGAQMLSSGGLSSSAIGAGAASFTGWGLGSSIGCAATCLGDPCYHD